ncbi:hypothetical protein NDU88_005723 [Pleurodeles waltl]|uniref:Uncharacterized protein n=1 Tax=Pleurodeles waltl TaxID=8319 RepID=A0AAV7QLU8_PLEWA|nr:hypothetical protein NDU88_005723 [Pleurodeles waltl]
MTSRTHSWTCPLRICPLTRLRTPQMHYYRSFHQKNRTLVAKGPIKEEEIRRDSRDPMRTETKRSLHWCIIPSSQTEINLALR